MRRDLLFQEISTWVWDKIIYHHAVGVEVDERGVTEEVVAKLLHGSKDDLDLGIWAAEGANESWYGSDIDLLIEQEDHGFVWFGLQAKVLHSTQKYLKLAYRSKHDYQWTKLARLATAIGWVPYYLIYHGVKNYHRYFNDELIGETFSAPELGCSVLSVKQVENYFRTGVYGRAFPIFRRFILAMRYAGAILCIRESSLAGKGSVATRCLPISADSIVLQVTGCFLTISLRNTRVFTDGIEKPRQCWQHMTAESGIRIIRLC